MSADMLCDDSDPMVPRWDDAEFIAGLQAEQAQAEERGEHHCVFTDEDDPTIPEGHDCGGCGCHLSAPCNHHLRHLPADDADELAHALRITGRWTRDPMTETRTP